MCTFVLLVDREVIWDVSWSVTAVYSLALFSMPISPSCSELPRMCSTHLSIRGTAQQSRLVMDVQCTQMYVSGGMRGSVGGCNVETSYVLFKRFFYLFKIQFKGKMVMIRRSDATQHVRSQCCGGIVLQSKCSQQSVIQHRTLKASPNRMFESQSSTLPPSSEYGFVKLAVLMNMTMMSVKWQ